MQQRHLEASIPLANEVTLAVGGQNIFDVFSDKMDLFAAEFGLPYSQFTPWGLSGGYYLLFITLIRNPPR